MRERNDRVKNFLILIFVVPIVLIAFGMYMDNWCMSIITDEKWRETQDQVCIISYNFIEQISSRINPQN